MTIHNFIENAIFNNSGASCLLIGEDHLNSDTLATLVRCRESIQRSERPIIILNECLSKISIKPSLLSRFFCKNHPHNEVAYTSLQLDQVLAKSFKTKQDKSHFETLLKMGALLYGIETPVTDPFILLESIQDKKLFCETAKILLSFLFQNNPHLEEFFQDPSMGLDDLQFALKLRYGQSIQRLNVANEEWTKQIFQFAHYYPNALIICCVGAGHIPQARLLSSNEVIEPGMLNRLRHRDLNVSACVCDRDNDTMDYQPNGEGTLEFDIIPKLTTVPYRKLSPQ